MSERDKDYARESIHVRETDGAIVYCSRWARKAGVDVPRFIDCVSDSLFGSDEIDWPEVFAGYEAMEAS